MITPSIKTLLTIPGVDADKAAALKRILTASRRELEEMPAGAARVAECYHAPSTADLRLTCLDAELGTYGVEAFQDDKGQWVEYCNAGDSYALTIIRWRGNYRVGCWGDIAERHCA